LTAFLGTLSRPELPAFEFRHQSWFTDEVYAALRAAGSALCVADTAEGDVDVLGTTDWGYLRLRRARSWPCGSWSWPRGPRRILASWNGSRES
jgi:uncharacterized protein YecE (DUF72 family)